MQKKVMGDIALDVKGQIIINITVNLKEVNAEFASIRATLNKHIIRLRKIN